MKNSRIANNTLMLMIFNIAKILFPFITLPYLTRVLGTETYGTVSYVKTVMSYMQILVDFGFVLSATKDIVNSRDNQNKMGYIIGDTLLARVILGVIGLITIIILCFYLPILKESVLYTLLSYFVIFLSIFLMDFLFRGIEKMHIITIRFLLMKTISTLLTFVFIKGDTDILLIPILDIISSSFAVILVGFEINKLNIKIKFTGLKKAIISIKDSFVFFLSNVASTTFNALSTIIIGIYLSKTDVAYWGVCMQIIGSIQACYSPISDGIYPEMIKTKNINLIKKMIKLFFPVVITGCIAAYFLSDLGMYILGGVAYLKAAVIFRILIPALFFSFFAILIGWPGLGSIGKNKETTLSTIISCVVYIFSLFLLVFTNQFSLINVAVVRTLADVILFVVRFYYIFKYRSLFNS